MLSFIKPTVGVKASAYAPGRAYVATPAPSRKSVRRPAPVARPALLLDQPLSRDNPRRSSNVFSDLFNLVVQWVEPQEQNHVGEEQLLAELSASMDHESGHGGWVHSHIADRLATEPSSRMPVDTKEM